MRKNTTGSGRIILLTRRQQPSGTMQHARCFLAVLVPKLFLEQLTVYPKCLFNLRVNAAFPNRVIYCPWMVRIPPRSRLMRDRQLRYCQLVIQCPS